MRKNPSSSQIRHRARELRQEMTAVETTLWAKLRGRRFHDLKFRRQHSIGRFVVDFYCAEYKIAIEIDWPIHEQQVESDTDRTEFLNSAGYKVIRFSNNEVLSNIDSVLNKVAKVCGL